MTSANRIRVNKRLFHPSSQHSCAGGGFCAVKNPEKRTLLLLRPHCLAEFKIPSCRKVKLKILPVVEQRQLRYVCDLGHLCFGNIGKKRADRPDDRRSALCRLLSDSTELTADGCKALHIIKSFVLPSGNKGVKPLGSELVYPRMKVGRVAQHYLLRLIYTKLVQDSFIRVLSLKTGCCHLSGRNVNKGNSRRASVKADGTEVIVLRLDKLSVVDNGSGSDDADNIALYKPLCFCRVFHLLADNDLIALCNKPPDILVCAVERHSAHRCALGLAAVSAGERQLKLL